MEVGVRYDSELIECKLCEHKWLGYIHIDVIIWIDGSIEESRSEVFECPKCGMFEGYIQKK
jgi:hypothetical protein